MLYMMTNTKTTIEVRTAHFEGNHTSYDWQPYEVEVINETGRSLVVRTNRLIEGHKRAVDGTYKLRKAQVR